MKRFQYKGFKIELEKAQFKHEQKDYYKWVMRNKTPFIIRTTPLFIESDTEKYKKISKKYIDRFWLREVTRKV